MANQNLKEFLSYISKHGVAKTNRFQVIIPLPEKLLGKIGNVEQDKTSSFFGSDIIKLVKSFVGGSQAEIARGLEIMAHETSLPGKNLATTDIRYNGDFYKLPYSVLYEPQEFSFKVSQDLYEKNIIDEWTNIVLNPKTHEVEYMNEYATNITINQLDQLDQIVYSVVLRDAFPIICTPITLSNESRDEFMRLNVTFAYRKWNRVGEEDGENSLIDSLSQTPLGPLLAPILSNPAVQRTLDFIERETGLDIEGEAVNIYNQVDDIVRATTGTSVNKTISLLEALRAATELNDNLPGIQKAKILEYIENVLNKLRGQ